MAYAKYTLWTIPPSEWTPLPNIELTPELEVRIIAALRDFDTKKLEERLKKFNGTRRL